MEPTASESDREKNIMTIQKLHAPNVIKSESCQVRLSTKDHKSICTQRNLLVALETTCKVALQILIAFSDARRWLPSANKEQLFQFNGIMHTDIIEMMDNMEVLLCVHETSKKRWGIIRLT